MNRRAPQTREQGGGLFRRQRWHWDTRNAEKWIAAHPRGGSDTSRLEGFVCVCAVFFFPFSVVCHLQKSAYFGMSNAISTPKYRPQPSILCCKPADASQPLTWQRDTTHMPRIGVPLPKQWFGVFFLLQLCPSLRESGRCSHLDVSWFIRESLSWVNNTTEKGCNFFTCPLDQNFLFS